MLKHYNIFYKLHHCVEIAETIEMSTEKVEFIMQKPLLSNQKHLCEELIPCPGLEHQSCGCKKIFDTENESMVYFINQGS